jgi:hypothetical protein
MKGITRSALTVVAAIALFVAPSLRSGQAAAQHDHAAAERAMAALPDSIGRLHMEMTPLRKATKTDSIKALSVANELRAAIAKYADTAAAVRDGFKQFAPQMKSQKTYHFTRTMNGVTAAFRFNASRPTSLLYEKDSTGRLRLVGAMYTLPKRASLERLNDRIPLSIAQWHRHMNWCVPGKRHQDRWLERRNGLPVFGPESPIATEAECTKVGGEFHRSPFGWMIHANVFAGDDLGAVFGHHH